MNSIAEVRHHIGVVRDTGKITKAMYLISSAKMKKAMRMHDQNLIYLRRVRSGIRFIIESSNIKIRNPYYRQHGKKAGFLVIAGDKGLCGSYNSEVLKLARRTIMDGGLDVRRVFTVGHMAEDYINRLGVKTDLDYVHIIQDPTLDNAREITMRFCELFRSKELDEVYVIYTIMEKIGQWQPIVLRLLPILPEDFRDADIYHAPTGGLVFHPSAPEVLDAMVPDYLIGVVYSALVQSYACEHNARMTAMDAATRNANDMLSRLSLDLNHARQAVITQEISEIIAGSPQPAQ